MSLFYAAQTTQHNTPFLTLNLILGTLHTGHTRCKNSKSSSYDGNDPQGMIEAEEGGMECNSFDGGDMLDDSFDEIETKQRRLSNPDYELEIEMGHTGERDDKERP